MFAIFFVIFMSFFIFDVFIPLIVRSMFFFICKFNIGRSSRSSYIPSDDCEVCLYIFCKTGRIRNQEEREQADNKQ